MNIEELYDKVANTYNQSTSSEVLDKAKKIAVDLMIAHCQQLDAILALGVGDGSDLLLYKQHYPTADLHGLDISKNMLDKAKGHLDFTPYHGDIAQASALIQQRGFDLIIAHFVTAYLPLSVTLQESRALLSEHGLISIVTNTKNSFQRGQAMLSVLEASTNPIKSIIAHHVKKNLETTYVPTDLHELQATLTSNGFKLIATEEALIDIHLKTEEDVFQFFINGGWCAKALVHPILPHNFMRWMCRQLIHRYIEIPYQDTLNIEIVVAQKIRTVTVRERKS